ncbi:MAG: hypothetical protein ACTSPY_05935 [Candidatus Helarchaeota archaeon]
MAKTLRIVGGIIDLVGSGFFFIFVVSLYMFPYAEQKLVPLLYSLSIFIIATIGGIFLLLDNTKIGILTLIAAGMIVIGMFTPWVVPGYSGWLTTTWLIDIILIAIGGIIGLIAGSEKQT